MRIAICDDEKVSIDELSELLKSIPEAEHIFSFSDAESLIESIDEGHQYDVILMDIKFNKKQKNGIDYAEAICKILPFTQIIFVTGYNSYSQDIFQKPMNLCGFLVKPISKDKLVYLLHKAELDTKSFIMNSIRVETKTATVIVPFKHIRYVESQGHKSIIHTFREDISQYIKLEKMESSFPPSFIRCHKSYLVNMDEIVRIEGNQLEITGGKTVPISRSKYRETFDGFFEYSKRIVK